MTATDHARVPTPRTFSSPRDALREMAGLARSTVPLVRAYQGGLDPALRERVMVAVSRANACRECTRVHERWALHHGVSDEELESIGLADMAALDDESRAAVVFAAERADRRFRSPSSSDVERAARERLSPARREQVDAVARAMAFANLTLNTCKAAVAAGPSAREDHPVFARVWQLLGPRAMAAEDRAQLVAGLHGDVVELGPGNGLNFRHYPVSVRSVLAVEPELHLRSHAEQAAAAMPVTIDVVAGSAEAIPAEDASFDAAVACLVLCSVPDQHAALVELRRVLRPGGELRFYEHVVADDRPRATLQRALDTSGLWPRLGAGCHLSRDTASAIEDAGFVIEDCRPSDSGPIPHIAGAARCLP